ncbi:hypothetical protein [Variovorax sp. E3]|uniref:hypothetical protein n=1 Tax=Variovorax sp. E3 TaxID=1914993 RepID=UPI0018DBD2D3|nr:hypothetical protein [Variovorax sp. E3]
MNGQIYLRRRSRVLAQPGRAMLPPAYLATLYKELEALGFTLSPALDACLGTWEARPFEVFYKALLKDIREMKGVHHTWRPLYPDFPAQVVRASAAELFLNAVRHYASFGTWRPDETASPRRDLGEAARRAHLRTIDIGTQQDFEQIFTQLAGARSSLSPQDKDDLDWFVRQYGGKVYAWMPAQFVSKENLATLGGALLRAEEPGALPFLEAHLQTATDVLRLAVAWSKGDVSLAEPTKFARMKRPMRRWLIAMMDRCGSVAEDMARRPEVFKRLGEVLHPGEYAKRFPAAAAAFEGVRNGVRPQGFNHHIERQLEMRAIDDALALLPTRPGEFARRLDHVLRVAPQPADVLARFEAVADQASTAVLLQAMVQFRRRGEHTLRSFFPKGETANVFAIEDTRAPCRKARPGRPRPCAKPRCCGALRSFRRSAAAMSTRTCATTSCRSRSARPRRRCARWCAAAVCRCRRATSCASSSGGRTAANARTSTCRRRSSTHATSTWTCLRTTT